METVLIQDKVRWRKILFYFGVMNHTFPPYVITHHWPIKDVEMVKQIILTLQHCFADVSRMFTHVHRILIFRHESHPQSQWCLNPVAFSQHNYWSITSLVESAHCIDWHVAAPNTETVSSTTSFTSKYSRTLGHDLAKKCNTSSLADIDVASSWRCRSSCVKEIFLNDKLDDNPMRHAGEETMAWRREQQEARSSQSELPLTLWLLKVDEQDETNSATHTHTLTRSIPVGIFTAAILACQDSRHLVPETPKASEKLQRDERIMDKTVSPRVFSYI